METARQATPEKSVRDSVSQAEWALRIELAACYRMIANLGWDDLVFTHISARVPGAEDHFLLNPYGLMFDEITASSLVKLDIKGNKVMPSPYDVIPAGFNIHSAVHEAREDALCVIHLHTPEGVAVSCQKGRLRPVSQTALYALASIAYHPYEGVALEEEEKPRLQADLGKKKMMILENHGLLTCGRSVGDAFLAMFTLQRACQVQVMAQAGGGELIEIPKPILDGIGRQVRQTLGNSGSDRVWPAIIRKMERLDPSFRD
ncbi:MAG: class II aldolase/adducin family protein [Parvibaculaceae bacterium]|nr:class II aldolase/adducin family protein [Parvibaculaceae bacterium]